ncbi:MAG: hypothetical protein V5B36_00885 [Candidatus Accumulibacter sp. UW25]|jgi:hypothetical protein
MTYLASSVIGADFTNVDTTPKFPIGTRTRGIDPVYGEGEFIYLKGVASTAVGLAATYNLNANTTTLTVAGARGPVAVAMAATVASTYGWYQVYGAAIVKTGTILANKALYVTATPGSLDDAVVAGDMIVGAVSATADGTPSAGYAIVQLANPVLTALG